MPRVMFQPVIRICPTFVIFGLPNHKQYGDAHIGSTLQKHGQADFENHADHVIDFGDNYFEFHVLGRVR